MPKTKTSQSALYSNLINTAGDKNDDCPVFFVLFFLMVTYFCTGTPVV